MLVMKNLFPTFVAVLFAFASLSLVQAQDPKGGVVPAPQPTVEQTELVAAEAALAEARATLTAVQTANQEAIAAYKSQEKTVLSATADRVKAHKPHSLFADTQIPRTYTTPAADVPARLADAKRKLDEATAAMAAAVPPVTPTDLNPTPAAAALIAAYNKADARWTNVRVEAQKLRMLVAKGPTDKTEKDEYAGWRFKMEAPENWTVEMIVEAIYTRDLEYEERMIAKLNELKPAYDIAVQAISEAEANVKAKQETRDRISGNVKIEKIGEGLEELKGVKKELGGIKTAIDNLALKFDSLTEAIAARQIASQAEATAIANLLNRVEELRVANNLNAKIILDLQRAQTFVTYAQPGQGGYNVVCNRNGRRCWSVAN